MKRRFRYLELLSGLACALAIGLIAPVHARGAASAPRVADRGERIEVDIDTNFDGRPDIQEFYEHGLLVRRESDRNFDDQVDLIEEFDATTQEHIRSVVDIDYDGTADLLVLFHEGRPVFTQYDAVSRNRSTSAGHSGSPSAGPDGGHGSLAPMRDPFGDQTSVRGVRAPSRPHDAGLSTSGAMPETSVTVIAPAASTDFAAHGRQSHTLPDPALAPLRGPPLD